MFYVLCPSGDRSLWDFRGMPSLTETCQRQRDYLLLCKNEFKGAAKALDLWLWSFNKCIDEFIASWRRAKWPRLHALLHEIPGSVPCHVDAALPVVRFWAGPNWFDRTKEIADWMLRSTWKPVSATVGLYVLWRLLRLLRSNWREVRTVFDGQDAIAFCAYCSPQLVDADMMTLGNAYEKRFHVPAACERCSWFWRWRGWKDARLRIGNSHYQFLGTYTALRMQRERDVHSPAVNQLDVPHEYRFAHRFMQQHVGTLGVLEGKRRYCFSRHTRSYCLSSLWEEVKDGEAAKYKGNAPNNATPQAEAETETSHLQRMRRLWQFVYDHGRQLPQSTLLDAAFTRCQELMGRRVSPIVDTTAHSRAATVNLTDRLADADYMTPPEGVTMAPVASETAQAVGPVTHAVTVHNSQDKVSVMAALEGRSTVKKSVFPDAEGNFPDLCFKKGSKAAQRLNKFWRKFNLECLTDEAIDRAYHKLYSGKEFREITMSKFSKEDVEAIQLELQTTTQAERLGTRKANGKLESVLKAGKPARLVVDNTLQLLALNIISTGVFQHILFDHDDGIFYNMSIKHRPREVVLDGFAKWMKDPWGDKKRVAEGKAPRVPETCAWEIDQTGMELHERCSRQGEGLLGYTYNALLRINRRLSHKINGEFTNLHEAKIVHDVKTGMRVRFRVRCPDVPKETWFTARFGDMYLDSGWALTSGVNFINELSGVFASITENPEHLFAINRDSGKFRVQDGSFDWKFRSIPLYQTPESPAPASFDIYLRGLFEGDDGGGAASRCLSDERNGGPKGLIVREQEDLGYSAKFKTIVSGRVEIIGAHFPVDDGHVCDEVPWVPAVQRYTSKLGVQTNVRITPSSMAARFLSLASMFAGRIEPLQRAFELSATRIIDLHGKDKQFWSTVIKTDGYHEIDRAFGDGLHCEYTMEDIKAHYDRCANKVHQTTQTQIRMLNMSIAEDVRGNTVTRDDFAKLGLFADTCRTFSGDDEAAYSLLPACFR